MNKVQIRIDVVSDVVCPWCYIGKRRLEKALSQLPSHYEVELSFLPFELNPDLPVNGSDQKGYLTKKFGGDERYQQVTSRVTEVAAGEGLKFDFKKQSIMPNTFDSHRLIQFAKKFGKQAEVKEALMKAYFEDGIDLSRKENLADVVTATGMDRTLVEAFLASEEGKEEVRAMEKLNYQRGISGVPFYIINNKYGVSGAQPPEAFLEILTGDL